MPRDIDSGDWREYKNLVVDSLRSLNEDMRTMRETVDRKFLDLSTQLAAVKVEVKSSARNWGLLAGIIPALLVLILWRIIEH